jgi:hypothetical protein
MDVTVTLTENEVMLLLEALDCYEYWELGQNLPRNDGAVFLPGDSVDPSDPYWPAEPTEEEADAIAAVRRSRALADLLDRRARLLS